MDTFILVNVLYSLNGYLTSHVWRFCSLQSFQPPFGNQTNHTRPSEPDMKKVKKYYCTVTYFPNTPEKQV